MKKLTFILIVLLLASCSPSKRLARLLEKYPQPERVDTVYTPGKTVYIDTTIYVQIPGETDTVEVLVDVPIDLPDTTIYASTLLANAKASLYNNILRLKLEQREKVLEFLLDSTIREHSDTLIVTKENVVTVTEYRDKPFYKSGFFILAGLIIIALLFYFLLKRG